MPAWGSDSIRRTPSVTDEFLTVAEVAAILRLNQQTIRNWIAADRLRCRDRDLQAARRASTSKPTLSRQT